ncbi:hypothetical protein M404DRAFT_1009139, partial [Pisolithus tinctorius Marx 270]
MTHHAQDRTFSNQGGLVSAYLKAFRALVLRGATHRMHLMLWETQSSCSNIGCYGLHLLWFPTCRKEPFLRLHQTNWYDLRRSR